MHFFKSNILFYSLTLLFIAALAVLLCVFDKGGLHLWLNTYHTLWLDYTMRYFTLIADYGVYVVALGLMFYKAGSAVTVAACNLLSSLFTQIIKHAVGALRPATWFAENMPDVQLQFIDGVHIHFYNSFPSGHTTAFFALAVALCYVVSTSRLCTNKKRAWLCILFLVASIGGYSRMYLSQQFAADVLAGCLVGTIVSSAVIFLIETYRIDEYEWWSWHISLATH